MRMRHLSHRLPIALLALASAGLGAAPAPLKVLFVGNSLTAANDLPNLVEALGKANGQPIVTRTVAYPNYSLEDHWQHGDSRNAIAQGGWSYVVLQQGPSALPESRALLVEYARRFAGEAKRIHARIAFYMVWPASNRPFDFDGVQRSYEAAAHETGGLVLPAGQAWRLAWARDSHLEFYGVDGFHPTPLGSYLAAMVIYHGLTGRAPVRPAAGVLPGAPWKILQQAAVQAFP